MAALARNLAGKGLFVFAFDFRGHGFSQGRLAYGRLAVDVGAAVKAVRGLGARKVVVMGASLGGIAAIVAAANVKPPLDGVAAISAPRGDRGAPRRLPSARLRFRRCTSRLSRTRTTRTTSPPTLNASSTTGSPDKRLELVPGALHGVFLVNGSAPVRALLERFSRDPRAAVRT